MGGKGWVQTLLHLHSWVGCALGWFCFYRCVVPVRVTVWEGRLVLHVVLIGRGGFLWFGFGDIRGRYFGWQSWIQQFTWANCLLHWSRASDYFYLAARNWLHQTSIRTCIGWFYAGKGSKLYVWADQLLKTQFWFTMQTQGDGG
ncbi:hypothetical protein Hanom_Chr09g00795031 [Helianthus anomalus]